MMNTTKIIKKNKYHTILAQYFGTKQLYLIDQNENTFNVRKVTELFWQLRRGHQWNSLLTQIRDVNLLMASWRVNQFEVLSTWAELETVKPKSMPKAYDFVLRNLDAYVFLSGVHSATSEFLLLLADLFYYSGYLNETFWLCDTILRHFGSGDLLVPWQAIRLQCKLFIERGRKGDLQTAWNEVTRFRNLVEQEQNFRLLNEVMSVQETILLSANMNDEALKIINDHKELLSKLDMPSEYATCLGNEAVALTQKGELNKAYQIHLEEEKYCREQGDLDGLQICLGNKANLLQRMNQYSEALLVLAEQETVCSQIGKITSLANCYSNQAFAYAQLGLKEHARELLIKQEKLAREMGSDKHLTIALEAQKALNDM